MAEQPLESTPQTAGAERAYLPPASPPRNHGHTVAAWVTVSAVMLGAVVAAVGVVVAESWVFWLGLGIIVLGVLVGITLRKAGLGQPEPSGPTRGQAGDDVAATRGRPA